MFSLDALLAFMLFALVSSVTPGPNNVMLMTSGTNFGLRATVPHMFGVSIGFCVVLTVVGLGLAALFDAFPAARTVLTVVSVAYLLYLAAKIAMTKTAPTPTERSKPMTFVAALAFQWVNPKGWSMALTTATAYVPKDEPAGLLVITLIFGLINLPCCAVWVVMGVHVRRWLDAPRKLRTFNIVAAILLVVSVIPVIWS